MFCNYCGHDNQEGARFCEKCGKEAVGGRYSAEPQPHIPSYTAAAIVFTILGSVFAIVALVYSLQVNQLLYIGDVDGAIRAGRLAKIYFWIGCGIFIGLLVLAIITSGLSIADSYFSNYLWR